MVDWRRKAFGDLTAAFRFQDTARTTPPVLPDTTGPLVLAKFLASTLPKPALPAADQQAPKQEKGTRKRV